MGGSAAGQVHRGDLALRVLGPHALQSIGIATGLGFLGGMIWKFTVRDPNLAKIAKVNNVRLGAGASLAGGLASGVSGQLCRGKPGLGMMAREGDPLPPPC